MNDWIHKTARTFAVQMVAESELMLEGVPVLIPVEELIHTDDSPICDDPDCPCQPYDKRVAPDLEVSGLAVCCECGATCSVYEVLNGNEQDLETPCEHSWFAYQEISNGQHILE